MEGDLKMFAIFQEKIVNTLNENSYIPFEQKMYFIFGKIANLNGYSHNEIQNLIDELEHLNKEDLIKKIVRDVKLTISRISGISPIDLYISEELKDSNPLLRWLTPFYPVKGMTIDFEKIENNFLIKT